MKSVLVTGGTGTLGKHVVARLDELCADVRVLTRNPDPEAHAGHVGGDLATGEGISDAVAGVDTIIHCATNPRFYRVDVAGTETLLEAAREHEVGHLIYISIVGVDDNPFPYYRTKLRVEEQIAESGVPYTILRATQFHELILSVVGALSKLPIALVPKGFKSQPIDVEAVAGRLVELAQGEPVGRARDIGGPRVDLIADLLQVYGASVAKSRPVLPIGLPGKAARAFRAGANLLGPDGETLGGTFDDFLVRRGS